MADVVKIQLRRGTLAEWDANSTIVLGSGEIGVVVSPTASEQKFKIGNGQSTWAQLPYFLNSDSVTAAVTAGVNAVIDSAPDALNTLNELAAALDDDANFATTVTNLIDGKADSGHTHLVADITDLDLSTKQDVVEGVSDTEIGYLSEVTGDIQEQLDLKASSTHSHAISDITDLTTTLSDKADLSGASFTGAVSVTGSVSATNFVGSVATTTASLNFSTETFKTITLSGTTTFTASNYAAGRTVTVRVNPGASTRTINFPSGWVFVGTKPTDIAANKIGILTVTSFGTTESECVAAWAVQS